MNAQGFFFTASRLFCAAIPVPRLIGRARQELKIALPERESKALTCEFFSAEG
jgi:hypothetical protein